MSTNRCRLNAGGCLLALTLVLPAGVAAQEVLTGEAAFGGWTSDAPGVRRHITVDALPEPFASRSAGNGPGQRPRPEGAVPEVPDGFSVDLFADGLVGPRTLTVAPNGDVFVAESAAGRITVLGPDAGSEPSTFASGLNGPYGVALYPPGPDPEWVYVGESHRVIRYPYRSGDRSARGEPETVAANLPDGGHWTRDVVFSEDGERLFVAVGSQSNVAQGMGSLSPSQIEALEQRTMVGASWGEEADRAAVLVFPPEGGEGRYYASGIRNCSGLALQRETGALWCATNERDGLGDNLPPDYATSVGEGRFYGWPWYYAGDHEDPRHAGARPDLAGRVMVPDVLLQPHSAPLGIAFYEAEAFPDTHRGDAFVTMHGSWNRSERTGYKVVRLIIEDGVATGVYEDFMTGFVISDREVWGRPVGVAVAADGALLVSEDGSGTIWRVSAEGADE